MTSTPATASSPLLSMSATSVDSSLLSVPLLDMMDPDLLAMLSLLPSTATTTTSPCLSLECPSVSAASASSPTLFADTPYTISAAQQTTWLDEVFTTELLLRLTQLQLPATTTTTTTAAIAVEGAATVTCDPRLLLASTALHEVVQTDHEVFGTLPVHIEHVPSPLLTQEMSFDRADPLLSPLHWLLPHLSLLYDQLNTTITLPEHWLAIGQRTRELLEHLVAYTDMTLVDQSTLPLLRLASQLIQHIHQHLQLLLQHWQQEERLFSDVHARVHRICTHPIYHRSRRTNHSADTVAVCRAWLFAHSDKPYPTAEEKYHLCQATGLSLTQLNDWFVNARRRYLHPRPSTATPAPLSPTTEDVLARQLAVASP